MTNHDEVKVLLPWFVNGTLAEGEHSMVNTHIEECETCREDVEILVSMASEFTKDSAGEGAATHEQSAASAAFNRLLDRSPQPANGQRRENKGAPIAVLASLVAVSLVAVLFISMSVFLFEDRFATLGDRELALKDTPVVQVVFRPQATEQTIREVLLENGNEVLSGPSRQGVYRVRLGPNQDERIYLARLKHNDDVIFAEEELQP